MYKRSVIASSAVTDLFIVYLTISELLGIMVMETFCFLLNLIFVIHRIFVL